jgi:hypothetical protein
MTKNKPKVPRDIYAAIVRAEKRGKGLHLNADEVFYLAQMDSAIFHAAENCATECICDILEEPKGSCSFCLGRERGT